MKKLLSLLLIMLSLCSAAPASAAAKFTGIMDMSLKLPSGSALVTYTFGSGTQRMDMLMRMNKIPEPLKTSVITRASSPDQAYIINHESKSYTIVNLKTAAENSLLLDFDTNYKLARLGKQVIKGYTCEHISLTSTTEKLELWVTRDLGDFSTFRILQSQNPRLSNTSLSQTLKSAGIEGFPVRIIQKNDNGLYVLDLIKIQPKAVPSSEFAIPSGYVKVENNQKPLGTQQKAHLKNLMEKMKKFEK
ncbi:DUF4412 domain-containing protein [Chlorobium sp. KB01]|uniref:DUF4412 domain-containing protein n=1 Tax=Chlorobium sp. KB01 TaxID=1917528 RepID=UPI0009776826|nr:DUF4412 domain-containing protein [Chlorobium sp. KB01]